MKRFALLTLLCLLTTTSCSSYEPAYGPFDGKIVDAVTGKPIAGAFVGFVWAGQVTSLGIWSKRKGCLHAVLVRTDSEGRYVVPKQKIDFDTSNSTTLTDIGWSQEAWAPGYLLAEAGPADAHGSSELYSHQPGISYEEGSDLAMQRHTDRVTARGMELRLYLASSAVDALDFHNRMEPMAFRCVDDKKALATLAKARYEDSYRVVCEKPLPAEALDRHYLGVVHKELFELTNYDSIDVGRRHDSREASEKFDKDAGWETPTNIAEFKGYPHLKPELLPEYCSLVSLDPVNTETKP